MHTIALRKQSPQKGGESGAKQALSYEEEASEEQFVALSKEQVAELRKRQVMISPWRVIAWQLIVTVAMGLLAWLLTGRKAVVVSAVYGAIAVVIPAALFARGITSKVSSVNPGAAVFGFFLWEMVKIALTVAMLFAATRLVMDLSWPAMLIGLVVTMKVYWVALFVRPREQINVTSTENGV
jgi:ATP synthase protein I